MPIRFLGGPILRRCLDCTATIAGGSRCRACQRRINARKNARRAGSAVAVLPGFTGLVDLFHGRRAEDVAPDLRLIVEECGTERDRDYWQPTRGNVGAIMQTILGWCEQHPDAVFDAEG